MTRGDGDLTQALYEWNMRTAAAFFEDLGAFEVLLRNAIDKRFRARFCATKTAAPWYQQVTTLSDKAKEKVAIAVDRATKKGTIPEDPNRVVAELSFGFWRYLLSRQYSTTLWPVIQGAFVPVGPSQARPPNCRQQGRQPLLPQEPRRPPRTDL